MSMDRRKLAEAIKESRYRQISVTRASNGFLVEGYVSNGHSYKYVFESLDDLMANIDVLIDSIEKDYTTLIIEGAYGQHSRG